MKLRSCGMVRKELLTAEGTTTTPDAGDGAGHAIAAVRCHGGLDDLEGLTQSSDLEQVETSTHCTWLVSARL